MTRDQINEALQQVATHCDLLMETYEMVSLRGALYTLGYSEVEADEIIRAAAAAGFNYCIDSIIPNRKGEHVQQSVCWYGPDQLKDRVSFARAFTPKAVKDTAMRWGRSSAFGVDLTKS